MNWVEFVFFLYSIAYDYGFGSTANLTLKKMNFICSIILEL